MKPAPFEYYAPVTLAEALDLMNRLGYDAKLLAGGQSLIPVMNFRLAQPSAIVDLNRLGELERVEATAARGLRVGAMTRQSKVEHSAVVAQRAPLLHGTMPFIAHTQIRNRGTIGGSLAHADPAAELPVIMVALEARFRLRRTGDERWVAAEDFYQALFTTALEPDEILVEVVMPPMPPRTGTAFLELARRHGDYALAGVAAVVGLDEVGVCQRARLVFLNVGEVPMVARRAAATLEGEYPTPALFAEAAALAAGAEIEPSGDIHATAGYKRHLAQVLGRRALEQAATRAAVGLNA